MARDAADEPPSTCHRCGASLTERHWVRLSVAHQGPLAGQYIDTERRICVDCVAALGMLEFSAPSTDDAPESGSVLRDRLPAIQSRLR